MDVSRMCPAMDRKKLHNDGQRRSEKLLVTGTFGLIRQALETVRVRLLIRRLWVQVPPPELHLPAAKRLIAHGRGLSWANVGQTCEPRFDSY